MERQIVSALAVFACLGMATSAWAQPSGAGATFTHGESKRCEGMTGADKQQCDREEGAKTQGPSSSTGGSAPEKDASFTHGESKRCESMSGAEKDQCDKEEATKTEGPAAQEAAKP